MAIDWRKVQRRVRDQTAGRWLLTACSWLYAAAVWLRGLAYRGGLARRRKLSIRTVCFGNLTAGGTGKTSAVLLAAEILVAEKRRPAVLSRGYKRPSGGDGVVVLADSSPAGWREAGDEPWLIRESLRDRGVPVFVSPDRYASGMRAAKEHKADIALLDDGFQHFALERDADVVCVNAADPFGGGLLPLGIGREPRSALARADLILLTGVDRVGKAELARVRRELEDAAPKVPVAEAVHRPRHFLEPLTGERIKLAAIKGREAVALSGIGDPEGFEALVESLGATLVQRWRYPDHHVYREPELRSLSNAAGGRLVVTTLKDLPRLPASWRDSFGGELWVLSVGLKLLHGQQEWRKAVFGK